MRLYKASMRMRDVTTVMKSLLWGKTAWISYGREHFLCCMSVKALANTFMIAAGRKEGTTKDLKALHVDFG